MSDTARAPRLIRLPEVMDKVGLSRSAIYARIQNGTFPAPVNLGRNIAVWPEDAVNGWINEKIGAHKLVKEEAA